MRDAAFHALEGRRNDFFKRYAAVIQARWRGFKQRGVFLKQRASARFLQYYFKVYLASHDCSGQVEGALHNLQSGGDARVDTSAVQMLESLCQRQANVDTVVEQGGIGAIVNAMNQTAAADASLSDDARRDMMAASARALGRIAVNKVWKAAAFVCDSK